jgi:CDP-glucose 4,6-dehydratase
MSGGFWLGKRVLVTGATGFIGSWLTAELIREGAEVVALVRDWLPKSHFAMLGLEKKATVVRGDLLDFELLSRVVHEYAIDSCFHLAAQSLVGVANRSPRSTFECNVRGTWTLLEACRGSEAVERVVVASSDKAYGAHDRLPYEENFPLKGTFPYDASKACADILARSYSIAYSLPIAVARCANIYGGGDLNFSRLVPGTVRSVLLREPPVIRSDGTPVRDYLYIEDAVKAYLTLGERATGDGVRGEAFNFGTREPISVLALVRAVMELTGTSHLTPKILGSSPNELAEQYLSSDKAAGRLGWTPRITLREGLSRTVSWYRGYLGFETP